MALEPLHLVIVGNSALIQHSDVLVDPLHPLTKAVAEISHKRQKTEADHAELGWREWLGGRYTTDDGRPCVPARCLRTCLIEGARKFKAGKLIESGVYFTADSYALDCEDMPTTPEAMFADKRYVDRRSVGVGDKRVIRTRPRFPVGWVVGFGVDLDSEVVDAGTVRQALALAGRVVGLGDYRPLFGRFEVAS